MLFSNPNPRRMKEDWNARARQNARWFINTVHDRQADGEFDRTGRLEAERLVRADLPLLTQGRDPRCLRLLEIGCGIGRMTRPLAEIFGEVYATDVSGEMIVRGRRRLRDCANVIFAETNGVDFSAFADRFFDVIFCAFVYQHVPTADAIRANLADAYRVLRAGGIFKFQTNGVTNEAFRRLPKDTWAGEAFDERAIRSLAQQLDAQMLSVSGSGSQYCWAVWRRRMADRKATEAPVLMSAPVPDRARCRRQSIEIAGLDAETADINNVMVQLGETSIEPCSVCPARDRAEALPPLRIEFDIPDAIPVGPRLLTVRLQNGASSPFITIEVPPPRAVDPSIVLITNGKDGGLDIEATGPKSHVRLFVDAISAWPDWERLAVLLGRERVLPRRISFVPGNGLHMVEFAMPDMPPHDIPVALVLGDRRSASVTLQVRPPDPADAGSGPAAHDRAGERIVPMVSAAKPSVAAIAQELFRHVDGDAARRYISNHARRYSETIGLIPVDRPMKVLDLGAFAPLTALLKQITPHEYTLHAAPGPERFCEISVGGDLFPVHRFDLEKEPFPFPDASFDMVICAEVLEHLGLDPLFMMSEINRVLAIGGWLLLSTPNIVCTRSALKTLLGYAPYLYSSFTLSTDRHNREYTPGEVASLVGASGFTLENLLTFNVYLPSDLVSVATRVGQLVVDVLVRLLDTSALRGDTIFALSRKSGPVTSRYPESFYDIGAHQS